ncbi:MAG TPA: hypothetical protein VH877_21260 [Polyangia bacterium]|nr:hypothetical protein [Polyangia bacterium]
MKFAIHGHWYEKGLVVLLGLSLGLGATAGCSYTFDADKTDITLIGDPPPLDRYRKINPNPVTGTTIVQGSDGVPWVVLQEPLPLGGDTTTSRFRLVRLADPPAEEMLEARDIRIRYRAFYLLDGDPKGQDPIKLTIHTAGDPPSADAVFMMPPGMPFLLIGGPRDDVFLYAAQTPDTASYQVLRRDGTVLRTLPIPEGVEPMNLGGRATFVLSPDGTLLLVRDGKQRLRAYSTMDETPPTDLGTRPSFFYYLSGSKTVLTVGDDGIHRVRVSDGYDVPLEPEKVDSLEGGAFGRYYYIVGNELRRVPTDGSAPPEVVQEGALQLFAFAPNGAPVYSRDPRDRYFAGASDGWIGDWNFMERGRYVTFNYRERRMRWLEHAARDGGVGDLMSVRLDENARQGGPRLRLARNVSQYDDLDLSDPNGPDRGRLMVIENQAFTGPQSRMVVIDETSRTAEWLVPRAVSYRTIPDGTDDLMVDVVHDDTALTFDVYRVPLPVTRTP